MLAARLGRGVPGAAVAQLAGARGPLPARPPARRRVLRAGRALRRLRVVVVRADHDVAVRLARRMPVPADRARWSARSGSGPCRRGRSTRSGCTRNAWCRRDPGRVIDGSRRVLRRRMFRVARDRRRPAGARRREGRAPRGREPAVPLGVPADRRRRDLRQGHRLHRPSRGGGGQDLDRRRGELRRTSCATGRFFNGDFTGVGLHLRRLRGHLPPERPADGLRLARRPVRSAGQRGGAGRHPRQPSGLDRRGGVLPVRVRVGAGRGDPPSRTATLLASEPITFVQDTAPGGRSAARDAVARHPQAAFAPAADGSDARALAGQPRVAPAPDDRPAGRHDPGSSSRSCSTRCSAAT